jgi:hypothetical protein
LLFALPVTPMTTMTMMAARSRNWWMAEGFVGVINVPFEATGSLKIRRGSLRKKDADS